MRPSRNPVEESRSGSPLGGGETPGGERIAQTLEIWSLRSSRPLTEEDAREIAANMTGFFRVLLEWKAKKATLGVSRDRHAA
jgi:hypothetical protein